MTFGTFLYILSSQKPKKQWINFCNWIDIEFSEHNGMNEKASLCLHNVIKSKNIFERDDKNGDSRNRTWTQEEKKPSSLVMRGSSNGISRASITPNTLKFLPFSNIFILKRLIKK
jgi:hypothetical protein